MKAVETRAWRFETPPGDDCDIQCPDDDCAAWSPLAAWTVADLECETCGEHDAMECPVCGWLHDHVHGDLRPLKVRSLAVTHHELKGTPCMSQPPLPRPKNDAAPERFMRYLDGDQPASARPVPAIWHTPDTCGTCGEPRRVYGGVQTCAIGPNVHNPRVIRHKPKGTPAMLDLATDPVTRMQQITGDDPEWSAVRAGYDFVETMAPHANEALGAPVWAGYALRAAFVAGAKWQREQDQAARDL